MVGEIVKSIRLNEDDQWERLLLQTRHISGVESGNNYQTDNRDDDWYGSEDSDNERNLNKSLDTMI